MLRIGLQPRGPAASVWASANKSGGVRMAAGSSRGFAGAIDLRDHVVTVPNGSVSTAQSRPIVGSPVDSSSGPASRPRFPRHGRSMALLITIDIVATMLAALLMGTDVMWAIATAAVTVLTLEEGSLYRARLSWSILDDLPALITRVLASVALVTVGVVLSLGGLYLDFSSTAFTAVVIVGAVVIARGGVYAVIRHARRTGLVRHRTLLIGGGGVAADLAGILSRHSELGLQPIGYVHHVPTAHFDGLGLGYCGSVDDVESAIKRTGATVLLVAFGGATDAKVTDVLRVGEATRCALFVVPRLFEIMSLRGVRDHIGAVSVMRLQRPSHRGAAPAAKRAFDVVFTLAALLVLSPVLLGCALAVRSTGPGIIFKQVRIGKDGQDFNLFKFRSMRPADDTVTSTSWGGKSDPRITWVGRILRRTSLDELPQLFNVLAGDMTIVGPRPERPYFVEQFSREFPHYSHRHRVRAGLTGMAQVNGLRGEDSSIDLRARYDNYYIENWSLWGDLKVIIRTVGEVVRGGGG